MYLLCFISHMNEDDVHDVHYDHNYDVYDYYIYDNMLNGEDNIHMYNMYLSLNKDMYHKLYKNVASYNITKINIFSIHFLSYM